MSGTRVLITAPLKQDEGIFKEFQRSLDELTIPRGVTVDRHFIVNDCDEIIPFIRGASYEVINTGDRYNKAINTHIWTHDNLQKMPLLRNATIKAALDGGYDYWWSVDTDLVLQPETLTALLDADKDIVSEVFWTQTDKGSWWCNAWMFDQCDNDGHIKEWLEPGLYQVGMTGACTLVKTDVFRRGVSYDAIPCIKNALWGEDRWFCIRAACAGAEMWLDTHYPAEHLYTAQIYKEYMQRRRGNG